MKLDEQIGTQINCVNQLYVTEDIGKIDEWMVQRFFINLT